MLNRRQVLSHSARLATLLATAGLLPQAAHAAYNSAAFETKSMAELVKVLGTGEITVTVAVTAHKFSATAKDKIEAAGGSATILAAR